jgi:hypothetical protein
VNSDLMNAAKSTPKIDVSIKQGDIQLPNTALKKQAILAKDILHKPINPRWMRLNAFDQLAKLGALPIEINLQIRPDNIAKIHNLLMQMHRGFYNRGIYHPHELAFLENFDINETPIKTGTIKTKNVKFTLCFPDKTSKSLFVNFINSITNGILSPHSLKQFIENNYKKYFKLKYQQKKLLEGIDKANQGKKSTTEALNKTSDKNIGIATRKTDNEISIAENEINNAQDKIADLSNQHEATASKKNAKTGKITFSINLAISSALGVVTLMNISDTLKEWGKPKEGNGEMNARKQIISDLVSLGLMVADLTNQYRHIKLNTQLANAINAGIDVRPIESKLRLNTMVAKTINKVTAVITILEAIGDLKSSFDMMNMENKKYFKRRFWGSITLIFGTILALASSPVFIIAGVIIAIAGGIAVMFSKEYDNYTPIQHWLNRCCFGKHSEFDYLGYQAYCEDEQSIHSGFGLAMNDYIIMLYNIQTFIQLHSLYHKPEYKLIPEPNDTYPYQKHIYFYLDIPNFAQNNQNESAIAMIRLFINDFPHIKSEPDPLIEKCIDFTYRITSQKIELLAINKNYGDLNIISTDKKAYFDKHESRVIPLYNGNKSAPTYDDIIEPNEFTLITSESAANSNEPIQNGLIINKWIAGTVSVYSILKYKIIVQYNKNEEEPLIITKENKI